MCQPKYFACIFRLTQNKEGLINGSKNRSSVMNLAHRGAQNKRAVDRQEGTNSVCCGARLRGTFTYSHRRRRRSNKFSRITPYRRTWCTWWNGRRSSTNGRTGGAIGHWSHFTGVRWRHVCGGNHRYTQNHSQTKPHNNKFHHERHL